MFGRRRHHRKEKLRTVREVSAAAEVLLAQKENLDAMSWEGVRDIADELLRAVDRGDRESAHQLVIGLQSIADDNIRVLYRFNIPEADLENSRLLRSGMRILPSEVDGFEVPAGTASSTATLPVAAAAEPESSPAGAVDSLRPTDTGDPGVLLGVESVDDRPADRPFYRRDVYPSGRRAIEDVLAEEEPEEGVDRGSNGEEAWKALADETMRGGYSETAQVLMARASTHAREDAAMRLPEVDDTLVRESEGFREFLRTLGRRHPTVEG